jgi:cytochrome b5-like protein
MRTKITLSIALLLTLSVIAIVVSGLTKNEFGGMAPLVPLQPGAQHPIDPNKGAPVSTSTISTSTPAGIKSYTFFEFSKNSATSTCWTATNGKIYNVTPWMGQYPGGDKALTSVCGKDGTAVFARQYGGQARIEEELAPFFVGILIK